MGLFDRNPNEVAYTGGKKHFADVIKNSGPGDLLIWRQPEEDFNTNCTLIVMPGEEAIFIKGGTIEQTFDNGTYKLSTENYPKVGLWVLSSNENAIHFYKKLGFSDTGIVKEENLGEIITESFFTKEI